MAIIGQQARAFQNQKPSDKLIKIGLLVADDKAVDAKFGAEMAIAKANEKGGVNGQKIQLVTRSMAGVWGTGSNQAVELIFNDNVWAILGSHDGRNAHLVEQATTKTRVVFLSAWASDPTLSQAFVPWFFNLVPNDNQQASALVDEIYKKRKIDKLAVILEDNYDADKALKSFAETLKITGKATPLQLVYKTSDKDFSKKLSQLANSKIEGIVLFVQTKNATKIIQQIRQIDKTIPVFGTIALLGETVSSTVDFANYESLILVNSGNWLSLKAANFKNEFQKKYKKLPSAMATYAFDGMSMLIEAIKKSERHREKLQNALALIHYEGVTGIVQFDANGNRMGKVGLMQIKKGIPVAIDQ